MRKRDQKAKRQPVSIDDETARDLARIMRSASSYTERPDGKGGAYMRYLFDEADARALELHAKRLGLSTSTMLGAAMDLCYRDLTGEPLHPTTVEKLARRGVSILGKRDLN